MSVCVCAPLGGRQANRHNEVQTVTDRYFYPPNSVGGASQWQLDTHSSIHGAGEALKTVLKLTVIGNHGAQIRIKLI